MPPPPPPPPTATYRTVLLALMASLRGSSCEFRNCAASSVKHCVPQWSRHQDAAKDDFAVQRFLQTMASFHKLCFCSADAIYVFKRAPGQGVTMRGWDSARGRDYTKELRESIENITKVMPTLMPILMRTSRPTSRGTQIPHLTIPPYR